MSVSSIEKRLPKAEQLIAIAASVEVEKKKRTVLTEIGLQRVGNPPFDYLTQLYLPTARSEVAQLEETELMGHLSRHLGATGMQYKKIAQSSIESRREEVAWAHAKEQTQRTLVKIATKDATREEIDVASVRLKEQVAPTERGIAALKISRLLPRPASDCQLVGNLSNSLRSQKSCF